MRVNSRTIGQQIIAGFSVLLLLLLITAGVGMYALIRSSDATETTLRYQGIILKNKLGAPGALVLAHADLLQYLMTQERKFVAGWEKWTEVTRQMIVEARDTTVQAESRPLWDESLRLFNLAMEAGKQAVEAESAGRHAEAVRIHAERFQPVREQLFLTLERVMDSETKFSQKVSETVLSEASRASWMLQVIAAFAFVTGAGISWGVTRSIIRPLQEIASTLVSASSEIVAATTQQAAGTAEEATAIQQTSTTADEVKQTAQISAQKARAVSEAAKKSVQVSLEGRRIVEESVKGSQESKARMEAIAERILTLSEQAQAIGEIIVAVNDLAEQSNLLAVNAAIEAAKAGDAGKGFAVVAAEVKSLAEQSRQATARVRGNLNEIHRATQAAVMAAEQGTKASEGGEALARQAGESIRLLTESLTESAQAGQQILASAQQQVAGMDQMTLAMQNIKQASTQNMAATRQVEESAHNLNELARRLTALITKSENGYIVKSRLSERVRATA